MGAITTLLPYFFKYGYIALFVILYLSAAYLPFPANVALIAAGILSRFGVNGVHFNIFISAAIALTGNVLGDLTGYGLSYKFSNEKRRNRFQQRHKSFQKMEKYLKAHPFFTIGVTRLIGFASPIVNTLAGFTKLSFSTFFWSDLVGNVIYTLIYMGTGYLIGSASSNLTVLLQATTWVIVFITVLYGVALYFLNRE